MSGYDEFWKNVGRAEAHVWNGGDRDQVARMYCESLVGPTYLLQIRAPEKLKTGKEGRNFYLANAPLDLTAMRELRDWLSAEIAKHEPNEGKGG